MYKGSTSEEARLVNVSGSQYRVSWNQHNIQFARNGIIYSRAIDNFLHRSSVVSAKPNLVSTWKGNKMARFRWQLLRWPIGGHRVGSREAQCPGIFNCPGWSDMFLWASISTLSPDCKEGRFLCDELGIRLLKGQLLYGYRLYSQAQERWNEVVQLGHPVLAQSGTTNTFRNAHSPERGQLRVNGEWVPSFFWCWELLSLSILI